MKTMVDTCHATLDGAGLCWLNGPYGNKALYHKPLSDPCISVLDVASLAYHYGLTHVWVYPICGDFPIEVSQDEWSLHYQTRQHKIAGVSVWKRGQTNGVQIIFPHNTSWKWFNGAIAPEIVLTIHYLEQALGVPITGSPGRVGWAYLKKLYPEWSEAIEGVDWAAMGFKKSAAMDIVWKCSPERFTFLLSCLDDGRKHYVHKFDQGASYPYAASQTFMGAGTPKHVEGVFAENAAAHEKGNPQEVGVFHCLIEYAEYNPAMPPVWKEDKKGITDSGWLMGPIVRLLRSFGHKVIVTEGWVFPERHTMMKKWTENLWNIRMNFSNPLVGADWKNQRCSELAADGIKEVMNKTIGLTFSGKIEDDDEMKRPDIRLQTIARHRELVTHNIHKIATLYDETPILVYMDALYYLSDNPNGRAAFPELVRREGQFGGYRWEGAIPLEDAEFILSTGANEAVMLQALNGIGWSREL